MSLFIENVKSKAILTLSFGVLKLNATTLNKCLRLLDQSMPTDESVVIGIKQSILENGYNSAFPIVLHCDTRTTIDGFTRLKACTELVAEGLMNEIHIPFYTANESGSAFNPASRGSSADDISKLFKVPRHNGIQSGSIRRAAEQAIEASQMLDVIKLEGNFEKAFDSTRTQRHTSKITRESETFIAGYRAVCEVATKLELNPDNIKWAHWLALFCRHGATSANKAIVMKEVIENKGTTQRVRYERFIKCCELSSKFGGL